MTCAWLSKRLPRAIRGARGARVAAELRERRVVEGEALGQQVLDDDRRELPRARVQRPHGPDAREAAGELRRVLPLPGLELGLRFLVARLRGIAEVLEDADELLEGIDGRRHRVDDDGARGDEQDLVTGVSRSRN